eukprot:TRINITY_DN36690_c0_g1_i1.p1 TRINITY_DN36690_c0_g1~~TRINITY_DN36690_c0_g1_i1.p1  ORF type:complete len:579 (-),score=170.69 TRINITY_DN36690_c0_g1_i1:150-1886(-)
MAEEVLAAGQDLENLSFYGLVKWLTEAGQLLERIDRAAVAKNPTASDEALTEHKDDLIDSQSRLRRAIGASLETPSLTKRERPLAEEFLKDQMSKLQGQASKDERAAKAMERLKGILQQVQTTPVVVDSKAVRDIEVSIKQMQVEWKEVEPIYQKWEAGRHAFKSNADLQAFKRRYEDCKKLRETSDSRLEKALCARRPEGQSAAEVTKAPLMTPGWAAIAKKQATPKVAAVNATQARMQAERGAAAMAVEAAEKNKGKPKKKSSSGTSAWSTQTVSFAQRMQAELVAKVRGEAEEKDESEEDGFWEETGKPSKPAKAAAAKRPPAPPVPKQSAEESDQEEEDYVEDKVPDTSQKGKTGAKSSDKKKTKAKKKNDGDQQDQQGPAKVLSKPAWLTGAQNAFNGSVLQDLLSRSAWSMPSSTEEAEEKLSDLTERLPWSNPLGLVLSIDWAEFLGLQIDGGPIRTSKRGQSGALLRMQKNIPWLFGHYVTLVFFLNLLLDLSYFGLLALPFLAQAVLLLLPAGQIPPLESTQALLLQVAHFLLWLSFARSVWLMNLLVKIAVASGILGHLYVVKEIDEE